MMGGCQMSVNYSTSESGIRIVIVENKHMFSCISVLKLSESMEQKWTNRTRA